MSDSLPFIFITGFMGAGKSTTAAALARALDCAMIDLDQFVSEREGRSVPAMIDESGEEFFRGAETRALREVLERGRARIIALGGGTWTIERNRELILARGGLTVWLDASFELCWRRIAQGDGARPFARERESAQRLFHARCALYGQAALQVQVTEESSTEEIVSDIILALSHGKSN